MTLSLMRVLRGAALVAAVLLPSSLRAQECGQIPNECCPPESADSLFSVVFDAATAIFDDMMAQFLQNDSAAAAAAQAQGPLSPTMMASGTVTQAASGTCDPDPSSSFDEPGRIRFTVGTYGNIEERIQLSGPPDGMSGLARLYHSLLILDGSFPAWNGTEVHLKQADGEGPIPVPDMLASHLADEGEAVQPRPGTMPGLYIYQVGETFYHYGGPLETGANPQTTAIYSSSLYSGGPLTNQLSGAQLWQISGSQVATIEIRHVDGSVAKFVSFDPYEEGWSVEDRHLWRLFEVRDPYDNVATYAYNGKHQLTSITFPTGLKQVWTYSTGSPDSIQISYMQGSSTPTEAAARTWAIQFSGAQGTSNGRFFGRRLYRIYSPQRPVLADFTFGSGSAITGQIVREFGYDTSTRVLTEYHKVHTGTPFASTLSSSTALPDEEVMSIVFDASGRVASQTRSMLSEALTYSYPTSLLRTGDLPSSVQMDAIEATNAAGVRRRYEYDRKTGRVYSVFTMVKPASGSTTYDLQPRVVHASTENSSIGGVATSDVEPDTIEVYNVFDTTCVCNKPIERQVRSTRGTSTTIRTWNFEYDATSKLVTKTRAPNPEAGAGPFPSHVEWTYTYKRAMNNGTSGQAWGAWLPETEVTPDGTFTYEYSDWLNRTFAAAHGQIPGTTQRSLAGVRIQDSLTGSPSASGTAVVETIHRNLSNSPGSMSPQGSVAGQPRKVIDGDGVETVFEYSTSGHLSGTVVAGALETTFARDAVGNLTSMTANAGSSHAAVTTFEVMLGVGLPNEVSSTSAGLTREALGYFDRWGHLTAVRRNNKNSSGSSPSAHGGSGSSARDWVETRYVFHHLRLMEIYEDRLPRDAAAGTGQFLVTAFTYTADGRLDQVEHPNGAITEYDFDGFGTLYRSVTEDPTGTVSVRAPKTFVNPFLEVTGTYEFTDSDDLWTTITRNAAGAITQIQEPSTTAPTGYSPDPYVMETHSTGGAIHRYDIDQLGRVTKAETFASNGTTLLTSRALRHDQLHRQIWQKDVVLGYGSGDHHVAWRYAAGKASQLHSIERTAIGPTSYTFNSIGLLQTIRDDYSTGNTVGYTYHTKTPFVSLVTRTDLDVPSGTRVTTTAYDVDPFGRILAIKEGSPQLVHEYAYDSLGRVDRYEDPVGRQQKFLLDGQGRVVEHVRLGDGSDFIHNATTFTDSGEPDGRTKVSRSDGLGNVTVTHYDFAGRPFIVQNPGGDAVPTVSTPNKAMCLFAEYDGASRLKALYDGDLGKTEFARDGRGRMILRKLVNQTINGQASKSRIAQWNTLDWVRRDALGRIRMNDYQGELDDGSNFAVGVEQFDQDSLGRVHAERFRSAFAPTHVLETKSTFASGGSPFRSQLEYEDNLGAESAKMGFGRDAIGRLVEVQWDKAPGAGGAMQILAEYGWAGGLRRSRAVRYGNTAYPQGRSNFSYDGYGRLTQIKDDVYTASSTATTKSQFDYEYDAAHNLTKEKYAKVNGRVGDRFAYDAYHRLKDAWQGVDASTMAATGNPTSFNPSQVHEHLTYGLDHANNRTGITAQTGSSPVARSYTLQGSSHAQGPSNRYDEVSGWGVSTTVVLEYDDRGNLTYDGNFVFKYDYMNRLQEVWRVVPSGPIEAGEKYLEVEAGSLAGAEEDVKLEVPDLYTRLAREHTDPVFRNRLKARIRGGVVRITPTPSGGGGRPGWLPIEADLELAAVYAYDVFNRRTLSILVDPSVGETQIHTWDGWRQVVQSRLDWTGTAWVATPTKQFVWGSRLDEMVAYRRNHGGTWENYYLLHGGQDTAAKLVDSSGNVVEQYEYDPYGRVSVYVGSSTTAVAASAYGLPFLWKSVRLDEITGLLQMRNRYYSVELGRFLSTDLLGVWADFTNMGCEYAYAGNMPLTLGDPGGLQTSVPIQPTPCHTCHGANPGGIGQMVQLPPPPTPEDLLEEYKQSRDKKLQEIKSNEDWAAFWDTCETVFTGCAIGFAGVGEICHKVPLPKLQALRGLAWAAGAANTAAAFVCDYMERGNSKQNKKLAEEVEALNAMIEQMNRAGVGR